MMTKGNNICGMTVPENAELDVTMHSCNYVSQEAETAEAQVQGQPRPCSK